MNTQQILVIVIIVAALISAVLVSFLVTTTTTTSLLLPPNANTTATTIFQEPNNNKIQDSRGDAKLIPLYKTDIFPKVRDYHDILSAEVNKVSKDDGKSLLLLTIDLAGDANKNEKYETVLTCDYDHPCDPVTCCKPIDP